MKARHVIYSTMEIATGSFRNANIGLSVRARRSFNSSNSKGPGDTADASRLERVPPTARRRRRARVRASTHLALTLLDGLSASFSSRTAAPLRHTAWGPRRTRHTWVALARPRRVGAWHAAHRRGRPLSSSPSSGHQRVVRRVCTDAPLMLSLTCRRQTFRHRRRYVGPS